MKKERTSATPKNPARVKRTPKKKAGTSKSRPVNPVRAKLAHVQECLEQLRSGLPGSEAEYADADSLTHAYVKSCVLMSLQRMVDINNVIIGVVLIGENPPAHKHHSFIIVQKHGVIDSETLAFFQTALDCYGTIANPYEELPLSQMYDVSLGLLKYGEAYVQQIERFFAGKDAKREREGATKTVGAL